MRSDKFNSALAYQARTLSLRSPAPCPMTETADDKDDVPGTPESARHERGIGKLSERSLHAALKQHLAQPGDQFEVKLGHYVIDLVRGDLLIEIQTRHLYALRPKLRRLLDDGRRIHLVHPLPAERWIVRQDAAGHGPQAARNV